MKPSPSTPLSQEVTLEVLRAEVMALRHELDHAYNGVETLPAHHPARIVYERTEKLEPK